MSTSRYSLRALVLYFLRLGTTGFGGPIALVGFMNRDLVQQRGWFTNEEYVSGLAFSQLAPGPMATQLAMYLGFLRGRVLGATLVGIAFILPSFILVVLLGALYVQYGQLTWIGSAFYGVGAAVIAIILRSSWKLTKTTLKKDITLWSIFAFSFAATVLAGTEMLWTFVAGGGVALLLSYINHGRKRKQQLNIVVLPTLLLQLNSVAENRSFLDILFYFLKAGFVVFGSGLAIVPFLRGGVVDEYHWLTARQFIDAVAVAMITPGPVVITVAFIGYLVHGFDGAAAAALGVFVPVYLFVIFLAPVFEKVSENEHVKSFVRGVTAVATGAISGAILLLGKSAITDLPTTLILIGSALLLVKFKVEEPLLIALAACAGLLIKL